LSTHWFSSHWFSCHRDSIRTSHPGHASTQRSEREAEAERAHPRDRRHGTGEVTAITAFVTPYTRGAARERFAAHVFEPFGLPDRLE
jgi:hypothetical protein